MDYKIVFGESLELIESMNKTYKYVRIGLNERYHVIYSHGEFRKEFIGIVEGSNKFLRGQVYQFDKDGSFRKKENEKKKQKDNIPYYAFAISFFEYMHSSQLDK